MKEYICPYCDSGFKRNDSRVTVEKPCCSLVCARKEKAKEHSRVELTCSNPKCKNTFWRQPWQLRTRDYNYCSTSCKNCKPVALTKTTKKYCKQCNKYFETYRNESDFCSKTCYSLYLDAQIYDRMSIHELQTKIQEVFVLQDRIRNPQVRYWYSRIIEAKCKECGLKDEWAGKKIALDIDHINGNSRDNRLENLRWLCPNCHRTTSTWGKKKSSLNPKKQRVRTLQVDFDEIAKETK
jgi:hypothetical protein